MNLCGYIWIIAWLVLFLLDNILGLKGNLCNKGLHIMNGEYYRIFTGLLLHINLFHISANIISMFFVCRFLKEQISWMKLLLFSLITGIAANALFSAVSPNGYMVGGSPVVFACIGLIIMLQLTRKDLPRFRLGTWYGNWIVGYAVLGNLPFFSKDASTLIIHLISLIVGIIVSVLATKIKIL